MFCIPRAVLFIHGPPLFRILALHGGAHIQRALRAKHVALVGVGHAHERERVQRRPAPCSGGGVKALLSESLVSNTNLS